MYTLPVGNKVPWVVYERMGYAENPNPSPLSTYMFCTMILIRRLWRLAPSEITTLNSIPVQQPIQAYLYAAYVYVPFTYLHVYSLVTLCRTAPHPASALACYKGRYQKFGCLPPYRIHTVYHTTPVLILSWLICQIGLSCDTS